MCTPKSYKENVEAVDHCLESWVDALLIERELGAGILFVETRDNLCYPGEAHGHKQLEVGGHRLLVDVALEVPLGN